METKDKIKLILLIVGLFSLVIYSFYIHRNEPHWMETRYIKIIK